MLNPSSEVHCPTTESLRASPQSIKLTFFTHLPCYYRELTIVSRPDKTFPPCTRTTEETFGASILSAAGLALAAEFDLKESGHTRLLETNINHGTTRFYRSAWPSRA